MNNKTTIGKLRLDAFTKNVIPLINNLSNEDLKNNWIKGNGLNKQKLSELVGHGCNTQTFRQNMALKLVLDLLENNLRSCGKLPATKEKAKKKITTQEQGKTNKEALFEFIKTKRKSKTPWPIDHRGRLYRKALWSEMSGQNIDDIDRIPSWFTSRSDCRELLDSLDSSIIKGELPTVDFKSESAMDEVTTDMTSTMVGNLKRKIKELQEALESERASKSEWMQTAEKLKQREESIPTGKTPRMD